MGCLGMRGRESEAYFEGLEVLDFLTVVLGQVIREGKRDLGVLQRDSRHAGAAGYVEAA